MKQRMLSLLLCCVIFCSAFSGDSLTGKAKEKSQEDSCGLEVHEHTEECYQLETHCIYQGEDGAGSSSEAGEAHTCTEESGCVTRVLVCPYAENEEETVPGDEGEKEPAVVWAWEWIDEEEMLVWSDELGQWGLGLPGANEENRVTAENLAEMLPTSITASLGEEQTEVLVLDWDFSVLPEGGAFEGSYTLTAALPDGYVLGDEAGELAVILEIGGGELYIPKFLNQWSFIPRMGNIVEENHVFKLELFIAEDQTSISVREVVKKVLPAQIKAWTSARDNMETVGLVFDHLGPGFEANGTMHPNAAWGQANISWRDEEISKASFAFEVPCVLHADVQSNAGHDIYVNSNIDGGGDTRTDKDILALTIIIHKLDLKKHIIPGINPANTTVNLFDYWVNTDGSQGNDLLEKGDIHLKDGISEEVKRTGMTDWNQGINQNKLLLFGDGNIHAGFWNKGAGSSSAYGNVKAGMPGIVEPVLQKGYPVIDTVEMEEQIDGFTGISDYKLCGDHKTGVPDERIHESDSPQNISKRVIANWENNGKDASLEYLFNPDIENGRNKRSYKDVKGLFQIDSNGYYYYDMRQNFAEYQEGKFILYDAPAVDRTDAASDGNISKGNFFPFNTGAQVFDGVAQKDGKEILSSSENIKSHNEWTNAAYYMNHHLGMTVNIDFCQPLGGVVNTGTTANVPMTFQFSGDDDVWIFIDDVLVLDLGGIHSEIYGTIDFSTGKVRVGQSWKTDGFPYKSDGTVDLETLYKKAPPTQETTLKKQFEKAKMDGVTLWNGDTFASNTSHTLKMFYLERGNYDSSLALRFNLQPQLYQQIKKVDQNGNPLAGVKFDLYPAEKTTEGTPGAIKCLYTDADVNKNVPFYIKRTEGKSPFVQLTTASDGTARFLDEYGNYFNFADRGKQYYILKETKTPDGYRTLPEDIVLYYDSDTSMLSVANRWNSGAYACSTVHVTGTGSLNYGNVDTTVGEIKKDPSLTVSREKQSNGLVVAIPMLEQKSDHTWETLYGSNISGFLACKIAKDGGEEAWREAALKAALEQAAGGNYPKWNLSWDSENLHMAAVLNDLPGLANRYKLMNPGGDMQMLYGIIEPEALKALGIKESTDEARYKALGKYVREHGAENTIKAIMGITVNDSVSGKGFSFLNPGQFNRNFRSLLYIPNEQRELWVMKIDQDGKPRNGAEFGIYATEACSGKPIASGKTANVNGQEGTLIFSPAPDNTPGHATIKWASSKRTHYYLKEISAPDGCTRNNTVIPVVVGTYSIYADAGKKGDGVSVMAGVGKLTQAMRQFAMSEDVDITLRDITAFQQTQPSENKEVLVQDWQNVKLNGSNVQRSLNLHYGKNTALDYGLHDQDGGKLYQPYFVTDTGFIRACVKQNYEALTANLYGEAKNDANKDNLGDTDLTNLFSLLNIVVVTDQTVQDTNTGRLAISKTVSGAGLSDADDCTENFMFTIHLTDKEGKELPGKYYFYGTDKAGYISSGEEFPLHHDEQIIIQGLPAGTRFTVTEKTNLAPGWYVLPETGIISGEIIKDATSFAPFFNSRAPWGDVGVLIVHKAVAGSGDRTKEFTFTITFTDEDGNLLKGSFPYTGEKAGTISSGDSVMLCHDEHIVISGLPAGTQYTVSEKEADQDGYTTSVLGESGVIINKEVHTAIFINRKESPKPQAPDPGSPSNPGERSGNSSNPDRTHSVAPVKTGDMTKILGLLVMLALLSFAALAFVPWKNITKKYVKRIRKKRKKLKAKKL